MYSLNCQYLVLCRMQSDSWLCFNVFICWCRVLCSVGCEDHCQAGSLGSWTDGGKWPQLLLQLDQNPAQFPGTCTAIEPLSGNIDFYEQLMIKKADHKKAVFIINHSIPSSLQPANKLCWLIWIIIGPTFCIWSWDEIIVIGFVRQHHISTCSWLLIRGI